jgi:preprotein translocase subunit YajC
MSLLAASNNNSGGLGNLLFPLILLAFLAFIFLAQRRRSRAVANVQTNLRPGVTVMTTAGLFATVQALDDDAVHLEIAPGVICRFARQAVARVLDPPVDTPIAEEEPPA